MKTVWKEHNGIRYLKQDGKKFYKVKFPSGVHGKIYANDEKEVLEKIDKLQNVSGIDRF